MKNFTVLAEKLIKKGFSVIPVNADKHPHVRKGTKLAPYQTTPPDLSKLSELFKLKKPHGIGIYPNVGNFGFIDIDCKNDQNGTLYADYRALIEKEDAELLDKLYIESTPKNGYHFLFKCKIKQKKRSLAANENNRVLIEQTTYIVVAPTPKYETLQGDIFKLPELSEREYNILIVCAKKLDRSEKKKISSTSTKAVTKQNKTTNEDSYLIAENVADDYNDRADIVQLLRGINWTVTKETAQKIFFLRDGDTTSKHSANWHKGLKKLYVHSSSTDYFEKDESYPLFNVYCCIHHNGNKHEALKELTAQGYGTITKTIRNKKKSTTKRKEEATPQQAKGSEPPAPAAAPGTKIEKVRTYIDKLDLRYNEITHHVEDSNGNNITDDVVNGYYIDLVSSNVKTSKDLITNYIFSTYTKRYNAISLFFVSINEKAKNVKGNYHTINKLLDTFDIKNENRTIIDGLITKWLVSIVAAAHGKPQPLTLVLIGQQNTGKTEFFRRLLPPQLSNYFCIDSLDSGKDSDILMTQMLLVLDDEFGGKSKKEAKHFKRISDQKYFNLRKPYGKITERMKRICVLCGTSNNHDVINDNTGNRRIIPVELISRDFQAYDTINRKRLFSELLAMYNDEGEKSYKLNQSELKYLNDLSDDYQQVNAERELILSHFVPIPATDPTAQKMTAAQIAGFLKEKYSIIISTKKIGQELTQLDFVAKRERLNGSKNAVKVYFVSVSDVSDVSD